MRLALAQINPTVGDIPGNAARIVRAIEEARAKGADLVVLPELALCGYPPKDLLLQEGFVKACVKAAQEIGEKHTAGITAIFGVPLPVDPHNPDAQGTAIANALLAYTDNTFIDSYDKRLLPTYDVFDEDRYFVPGDRAVVIDVPTRAGHTWRVGLSICEDLWRGEDVGFSHRYHGRKDPVAELCAEQPGGKPGAKLIINPSASPFVLGKGRRHRDILIKHAITNHVFVAAVNQVGGNDDLVFDGHAAVYAPGGGLLAAAPGFTEHVLSCDIPDTRPDPSALGTQHSALSPDPLLTAPDEQLLFHALTLGIRDYCRKTGFKSVVLGLSGGIDSAVCAVLAAAALGPKNVLGVALPSRFSSEGSKTDAADLARNLGIPFEMIPIESAHAALLGSLAPTFAAYNKSAADVTEENLQSRIRGTILMALSNKFGHLLLTTGNKSEMAVGYATLYGDMNGGLAVLSDVTKRYVYSLARWMNGVGMSDVRCAMADAGNNQMRIADSGLPIEIRNPKSEIRNLIPDSSITKPPSAELRPNQTDQDTLPPYDTLDEILSRYVEQRQHPTRIAQETGFDPAIVARIVRLIDLSEFKRKQAAIGLKVTGLAFGSGRRFPIAQGYRPDRDLTHPG